MNQTLEEILNVEAATGPFAPGDAVLEQTLRDFIQLQSNTIAIATDLVGVRSVPWLSFTWYTGVVGTFSYPLDDVALTDPTNIGTQNYSTKLEKGQGRCTFLDAVRLRGESFENIDRQQLGIVRARADTIDNHILTTLAAGADNSVACTQVFGHASADEEGDILKTMDNNSVFIANFPGSPRYGLQTARDAKDILEDYFDVVVIHGSDGGKTSSPVWAMTLKESLTETFKWGDLKNKL